MPNRAKQLQPAHKSADDLEGEVADIAAMNVEQLRARWRKTHRHPAPKGLSKDLIARALSYQDPRSSARRIEPGSAADFAVGYDKGGRASAENQSWIGSGPRVRRCAPRSGGGTRWLPLAGRDLRQSLHDRKGDHRHELERPPLLWSA